MVNIPPLKFKIDTLEAAPKSSYIVDIMYVYIYISEIHFSKPSFLVSIR